MGVADGDLDQFGADSWENVDGPLKKYITANENSDVSVLAKLVNNPVIIRHITSQFKRDNPVNFPRNVVAD